MVDNEMEQLSIDYLYERLSPSEKQRFEKALENDTALRAEIEALKSGLLFARKSKKESKLPSFDDEITQRLIEEARQVAQTMRKTSKIGSPHRDWNFHFAWPNVLRWKPALVFAVTLVIIISLSFWAGHLFTTLRGKKDVQIGPQQMANSSQEDLPPLEPPQNKKGPSIKDRPQTNKTTVAKAPEEKSQNSPLPKTAMGLKDQDSSLEPQSPEKLQFSLNYFLELGEQSFRRKHWSAALENFEQVIHLAPGSEQGMVASHHKARTWMVSGEATKARAQYEELLQHYPSYPQRGKVYLELGELCLKLNDAAKASEYLQKAYTDYPALRPRISPLLEKARENLPNKQTQ